MLSAATGVFAAGLMRSLVSVVFAAAGTVLGLLTGFVHEDGFMEGALLGAIAGALVSAELAGSLVTIWCCDGECSSMDARIKRTASALCGLVIIADPHIGRGERRGGEIFEPGFMAAAVQNLPVTKVTKETAGAGQTTCPICLHELEAGESARRLPACSHVFHLECIDSWLMLKSHCPMCRHAVC